MYGRKCFTLSTPNSATLMVTVECLKERLLWESQLTTTTKTAKMEGSIQAATGARHRSILDLPHFEVRRRICDWVAVMMPNLVVMGDHRQWGPLASSITGFGKFRGRN